MIALIQHIGVGGAAGILERPLLGSRFYPNGGADRIERGGIKPRFVPHKSMRTKIVFQGKTEGIEPIKNMVVGGGVRKKGRAHALGHAGGQVVPLTGVVIQRPCHKLGGQCPC